MDPSEHIGFIPAEKIATCFKRYSLEKPSSFVGNYSIPVVPKMASVGVVIGALGARARACRVVAPRYHVLDSPSMLIPAHYA